MFDCSANQERILKFYSYCGIDGIGSIEWTLKLDRSTNDTDSNANSNSDSNSNSNSDSNSNSSSDSNSNSNSDSDSGPNSGFYSLQDLIVKAQIFAEPHRHLPLKQTRLNTFCSGKIML